MEIRELRELIEAKRFRSAWDRGVKQYALELLENMDDDEEFYGNPANKKDLLDGADNWTHYSWSGNSLIYDCDIAERLCSQSELKRNKNGERCLNEMEEWPDTQARALRQASNLIFNVYRNNRKKARNTL